MPARLRAKLSYANVVSTLCLIFVVGGGSAYAVTKLDRNSVRSKHIVNGQVKSPDVKNDGLTGRDVNESRLGPVPSAGEADRLDGKDSAEFLGADAKAADADKLDDIDSSGFALAGSEAWQALTLVPSGVFCHYTNVGDAYNPAGYFRDRAGVVHLRGMVKAVDGSGFACGDFGAVDRRPNTGVPIPEGYRPANREVFTISSNHKPGRIDMRQDGRLELESPDYPAWADAKEWFSLDGISYRCAPAGVSGCP